MRVANLVSWFSSLLRLLGTIYMSFCYTDSWEMMVMLLLPLPRGWLVGISPPRNCTSNFPYFGFLFRAKLT